MSQRTLRVRRLAALHRALVPPEPHVAARRRELQAARRVAQAQRLAAEQGSLASRARQLAGIRELVPEAARARRVAQPVARTGGPAQTRRT